MKRKIVIAVTGASGAVFASVLFRKLREIKNQLDEVAVVFSSNARDIWDYELNENFEPVFPFRVYEDVILKQGGKLILQWGKNKI